MADGRAPRPASNEDVLALHESLSNWARFGERDQLGTLNLVTPERRIASKLAQSTRESRRFPAVSRIAAATA